MKKLLVSINPAMYKKYKGHSNGMNYIASEAAQCNFKHTDIDVCKARMACIAVFSDIEIIAEGNDFIFGSKKSGEFITYGTITIIDTNTLVPAVKL